MSDRKGQATYRVVCPEWQSKPMPREVAERRLAEVVALGACYGDHALVAVVASSGEQE